MTLTKVYNVDASNGAITIDLPLNPHERQTVKVSVGSVQHGVIIKGNGRGIYGSSDALRIDVPNTSVSLMNTSGDWVVTGTARLTPEYRTCIMNKDNLKRCLAAWGTEKKTGEYPLSPSQIAHRLRICTCYDKPIGGRGHEEVVEKSGPALPGYLGGGWRFRMGR